MTPCTNGLALPGTGSAIEGAPAAGAARLSVHDTLADLPAGAERLFADPAEDLFASRLWFATLAATGQPADHAPRFLLYSADGIPVALLPLASRIDGTGLTSLTGPYTLEFRPLFSSSAEARTAGMLMGRFCRQAGCMRLDALCADAPGLACFESGLRRAGLVVWRFDHFGNWFEPVAGLSFAAYLAARPGALRSTITRKMRRAGGRLAFSLHTHESGLEDGIAAYETVYAQSWKEPEPFPSFHPALMRATAGAGLLRLGILCLSGKPAAVQFWIVSGRRAVLLKLAHAEAFADSSPGSLLTALMIEQLLTREPIVELDFGRGDDAYKHLWAGHRRQRYGLMLANPLSRNGLGELTRSFLGAGRSCIRAALGAQRQP